MAPDWRTPPEPLSPDAPLALLGACLEEAGAALTAARRTIPACQDAEPGFAVRLEDLDVVLDDLLEHLANAAHPLLIRRLAEAQEPRGGVR